MAAAPGAVRTTGVLSTVTSAGWLMSTSTAAAASAASSTTVMVIHGMWMCVL